MKNKTKNSKKRVYDIILIVFIIIFLCCAVRIATYYIQLGTNEETNSSIQSEVVEYNFSVPEEYSQTSDQETKEELYKADIPSSINFTKLLQKNTEVVGWLFNQNGVINYPVLKGSDNDYYLDHLIDGRKNSSGSIFMNYTNEADFGDKNTLIYGHSMQNGTMFATLLRYRNYSYYEAYPSFYYYTPQKNYRIDIFAAYETDSNDFAYATNFSEQGFSDFLSSAVSKTNYRTNVAVGGEDKIVTFSTCAYSSDNARYVVIGKLVEIN